MKTTTIPNGYDPHESGGFWLYRPKSRIWPAIVISVIALVVAMYSIVKPQDTPAERKPWTTADWQEIERLREEIEYARN